MVGDATPTGLTFVSNAGDCTTAFPCDLGTVPAGATRTITATFAVPSGYTTPNPIANTATVSSATPDAALRQQQRDDQHAGRRGGDGSPHHEDQWRQRRGRGLADDLHDHHHQPARAERREWRDGHRRVPGDADRRHVDLCRARAAARAPPSGIGNINTPVTVPVGATVVFTATGTVDPAATGVLVNSAQVVPPAGLANRTSAIATDSDPITARADLGLTKTGPASIVAGNNLIYTITVTNAGPSDAAGVVVNDATPTGLVFVSNTGACTTAFPCTLGVVPAGATRTITATFTVPITYPGLGPIVNVASVSATTPDDTAANNTATVETPLNRNADVAISQDCLARRGARGPADHLHRGGDQSRAGACHRPRRPGPAPGRPGVRVGAHLRWAVTTTPPGRGRLGRC